MFDRFDIWLAGIGIGLLIIAFFKVRHRRNAKVTRLADYRKSSQRCSQCRSRTRKVVFYADPSGKVVGLCPECRRKSEHNGYLPI
jgi:hypothetical protein